MIAYRLAIAAAFLLGLAAQVAMFAPLATAVIPTCDTNTDASHEAITADGVYLVCSKDLA